MKGSLTQGSETVDATRQGIEQAAAGGTFFWLDLDIHDPGPDDDVTGMLTKTFHFHPVAVEAADKFGQRPRIDDYDDFVHVITFGMAADGQNVAEVHCFITEKFIISIHQGYRDLIRGAMDTHLSMVSNRLNVVMKQLAVIATIFLPLGFLTGFFGQNFAWPIAHLQANVGDFLFLGIGSELVAIILLV